MPTTARTRTIHRANIHTAISHSDEPRDRKLVNDSWPGVSIMSRPGIRYSRWRS